MWCGAKRSSALVLREANAVSYAVPNRATAKLSNALPGCVAAKVFANVSTPGYRNMRIRTA